VSEWVQGNRERQGDNKRDRLRGQERYKWKTKINKRTLKEKL